MTKALRLSVGAICAVGIVVAIAVYYFSQKTAGPEARAEFDSPATPAGITLQIFPGGPLPTRGDFSLIMPETRNFADSNSKSLYTYDKDLPGKSLCNDECAQKWPPALAAPTAKARGAWSIIERDDKQHQWAYRGKPLYTSTLDKRFGDNKGNGVDSVWHIAMLDPTSDIVLPFGLRIKEVTDAGGQTLIDDQGRTLYGYYSDMAHDRVSCTGPHCGIWLPFPAGQIARRVGDFSIIERGDGIRQWQYKGVPLYTYTGDLVEGDANGRDVNGHWRPAVVFKYFIPDNVLMQRTAASGIVLATREGKTLYKHDGWRVEVGSHNVPHSVLYAPGTGQAIGTEGCNAECLRSWHPFPAPADAVSTGYWDVLTRADGTKQWAYHGYALYSFEGDKKPGDVLGNDSFVYLVNNDFHKVTDVPTAYTDRLPGSGALDWTFAAP